MIFQLLCYNNSMNFAKRYYKLLIFPIFPLLFTVFWLCLSGFDTNISVLLSKPVINIIPYILCVMILCYLYFVFKHTSRILRIFFFTCAILTLVFPYLPIFKNLHLVFAYLSLIFYVLLFIQLPQFYQHQSLFYFVCFICFLDCAVRMEITGLSEMIFLWMNAYLLTK